MKKNKALAVPFVLWTLIFIVLPLVMVVWYGVTVEETIPYTEIAQADGSVMYQLEDGTMTAEKDGSVTFYLFLRVEGQTGRVPIDRYPGVRERNLNQLTCTLCTETLQALIDDPNVTVRNEALLASIRPDQAK